MLKRSLGVLVGFAGLAVALSAAPALAQDWKGKGRLDGRVINEKGEPIAGARLLFRLKGRDGPTVETDSKGRFAYYGFASGDWDLDISASGYATRNITVHLSELTRIPPMEIRLEKAAEAPPASGAPAAPDLKAEIVPTIEKGNALLEQKNYAGARAEYEKALAVVPDNPIILRAIARTYYGEKNLDGAIAALKKAAEKDPSDTQTLLLLANLDLEKGNVEEGKAILDKLPAGSVQDPAVYLNAGIMLLNRKNAAGAWEQFDRAVALKSDDAEAYFYRGLAAVQLKKRTEARADLRKYLELAPNGPQAGDAKDLLSSIK